MPAVALMVGVTVCGLAVGFALLRTIAEQLAHDSLVMRALGVTMTMSALMIARVALAASAGVRRVAALAISALFLVPGTILLIWPAGAALLYDRGMGTLAPWLVGAPGILALLLSRWRVR